MKEENNVTGSDFDRRLETIFEQLFNDHESGLPNGDVIKETIEKFIQLARTEGIMGEYLPAGVLHKLQIATLDHLMKVYRRVWDENLGKYRVMSDDEMSVEVREAQAFQQGLDNQD